MSKISVNINNLSCMCIDHQLHLERKQKAKEHFDSGLDGSYCSYDENNWCLYWEWSDGDYWEQKFDKNKHLIFYHKCWLNDNVDIRFMNIITCK